MNSLSKYCRSLFLALIMPCATCRICGTKTSHSLWSTSNCHRCRSRGCDPCYLLSRGRGERNLFGCI